MNQNELFDRFAAAMDEIQNSLAAERAGLPAQNPFVEHREILLSAGYGTAQRLQDLALHLWNDDAYPCRLGALAAGADAKHWKIAMDMIAWYRVHGENDRDFMALCREIYDLRTKVEAQAIAKRLGLDDYLEGE